MSKNLDGEDIEDLSILVGQVVQFTENHKWCGSLGFVVEVKECGGDYRFMIGATMPNNQTHCDTAYIFSMASKHEFEPLLNGKVKGDFFNEGVVAIIAALEGVSVEEAEQRLMRLEEETEK